GRQRRLSGRLTGLADTDDVIEPDPAGVLSAGDLLRRLSPERRTAFLLTQVAGLSYAEAARVEGCPVGTIRSRVARARMDLIEALAAASVA
ncbi:MAG: sigma factor-like helix-turn-helix DNA-binding protein, partial [Micromonosporaceae bacterium]